MTVASRGMRSAIAAKTCAARSGSPSAGGAGGAGGRATGAGVPGARRQRAQELGADRPGRCQQRQIGAAPVHLGRVVADHRDHRAGLDERPGDERVLPEHRRADGEHDVVRRQHLAQARAVGRQVTGEQRVILREPGARAERLLEDRTARAARPARRAPATCRDRRRPPRPRAPGSARGRRALRARRRRRRRRRDSAPPGAGPRARPARPRRQPSRPSGRSPAPGRCR